MYEELQVADSDVPPYSDEVYVETWDALLSYNESLFHLYDAQTGELRQEIPIDAGIERVAAGNNSYSVANRAYEILNLKLIEEHESKLLQGHQAPIAEMIYSDDDSQLVSIDADGHLIIWDTTTGEKLLDIVVAADDMFIGGDLFSPNVDMALSPENSLLVVNSVSPLLTFNQNPTRSTLQPGPAVVLDISGIKVSG